VVGPTGAGKTLLLNEIADILFGIPDGSEDISNGAQAKEGPRPYLPGVVVTAHTGRTYESRFRNLLMQILAQVNTVLMDVGKTFPDQKEIYSRTYGPTSRTVSSLPIAKLEELVRAGLKERKVKALLIDEAQHLAHNANKPEWRLVGDGLKVLGSISGTMVVMFGTSELLELPYISGQLGRRSKAIHLRRYLWDQPEDRKEFKKILTIYHRRWPTLLPKEMLLDNLPCLYAGSVGCVGTLSTWLYDAMAAAEQSGVSSVTWKILQECALSVPKLRKIVSEAEECETSFAEEQSDLREFASKLCDGVPVQEPKNSANGDQEVEPTANRRAKRRPFKRKPSYDAYKRKTTAQ
jgi:hypothetical protein